jgi:uncharacterized protein with HEPN domain
MIEDRERLEDVAEAIAAIERYSGRGREEFERNELIQEFFVRKIELIGEAVKGLSPGLQSRYSEVPWREIARMRDILLHHYRKVDWDLVWNVVEQHVPVLKAAVMDILRIDPQIGEDRRAPYDEDHGPPR